MLPPTARVAGGTALYSARLLAALATLGPTTSPSSTEPLRVSALPGHDRLAGRGASSHKSHRATRAPLCVKDPAARFAAPARRRP